jgi:hypothetical protein
MWSFFQQIDAQKKRQELTMYFSRLRDALDRREAELRGQLDHREQQVSHNYMTHSECAKRKEKLVDNVVDDARRLCTDNKIKFIQVQYVAFLYNTLSHNHNDIFHTSRKVPNNSEINVTIRRIGGQISHRLPLTAILVY